MGGLMGSPTYSKTKGREAENAAVACLQTQGWPYAERRRLAGSSDRGDIAGIPGVVIEVKNEKRIDLAGYMAELEVEIANDGADTGFAWVKKRGCTDARDWYAVLPAWRLLALLREAGYGTEQEDAA
jgi:hypothetical protein